MKTWVRTNALLAVAILAGLVLVIVIGLEYSFGASLANVLGRSENKRGVPADAKLLPALVAVGPEQAYPETVARPLFIPTRRPAPAAPVVAQAAIQRGQFVLQGTIVVGDKRVAMLREKSTNRVVRVELGKELNGMKVMAIEKEGVTLGLGSEEERLVLNVLKPPGPAAPPAAGPFAPAPVPAAVPPPGGLPVPGQPGVPNPAAPPGANPAAGGGGANPPARAVPEASAAGATPVADEALARRRANRRAQQQQGS